MTNGDVFVQSLRDPDFYEVGVAITKDGEDEVFEAPRTREASTQNQAVMEVRNQYKDDDWDIVRLRYIKKVYTTDD